MRPLAPLYADDPASLLQASRMPEALARLEAPMNIRTKPTSSGWTRQLSQA